MRLFELDPNNPIDRELERTSQDAEKDGSLDPNDETDGPIGGDAMGDPLGGGMDAPDASPDAAMAGAGMEPEAPPAKPVDSALLSRVQGHDYIQNYDHSDPNKPHHPINILNLEAGELSDLRNRIRGELDRTGLADETGQYANQQHTARTQMLAFVDLIMMHKKKKAKDDRTSSSDKPRVREQTPPKTKSGKQFKAKRF